MRKIFLSSIFLLLSLSLVAQEEDKVKKCFQDYKQAVLAEEADAALALISSKTTDYYGEIIKLALHADKAELDARSLTDKITVMRIRMSMKEADLKGMDGKKFFVYGIKEGLVDKKGMQNVDIGEIKVEGKEAKGAFVINGQSAPYFFKFDKENNQWKFDLTALFDITNQGLASVIEQTGITENEFLMEALSAIALEGELVGDNLWEPMAK
ncbi:MAG: hypothetical protein R8P61_26190 [Bacteroidia bacterium]|nr:hypothetical protein [Bacteroidia bacterium]